MVCQMSGMKKEREARDAELKGRKGFYKRRHVEKEVIRYLGDSEKVSD